MDPITVLPTELVVCILCSAKLSVQRLLLCRGLSKSYRAVINGSPELWQVVTFSRWPRFGSRSTLEYDAASLRVRQMNVLLPRVTALARNRVRELDVSETAAVLARGALEDFCAANNETLTVLRAVSLVTVGPNDAGVSNWVGGSARDRAKYIATYGKELGLDLLTFILDTAQNVQELHCDFYGRCCPDEPGFNTEVLEDVLAGHGQWRPVRVHSLTLIEDPYQMASHGFSLSDDGWTALARHSTITRIRSLPDPDAHPRFPDNGGDDSTCICPAIRTLRLTRLDLCDMDQPDGGVAIIDAAAGHATLQFLCLCRSAVGEEATGGGAEAVGDALGRLLRHPNCVLQRLDVGGCGLGAAVAPLFAALRHSALRTLICDNNDIPDGQARAILKAVRAAPQLGRLYIGDYETCCPQLVRRLVMLRGLVAMRR